MSSNQTTHRVFLVDDDQNVLDMMSRSLKSKRFEVVAVGGVTEALKCIATEHFEVLITDLHMPNAGDGFTVISAMRHSQPTALTMLLSGYPDVKSAMEAIIREADEIVVKPVEVKQLAELVREKLQTKKPADLRDEERVREILDRCAALVVRDWLVRVKASPSVNHLALGDEDRTGHLPRLIEDLISRLNRPATGSPHDDGAIHSPAAVLHGELRYAQGYTPEMLVQESRILQVTWFGTLKDNMNALDFSLLLPDVMTIGDEVDAQLTQTMSSFKLRPRMRRVEAQGRRPKPDQRENVTEMLCTFAVCPPPARELTSPGGAGQRCQSVGSGAV
jgi:ActR/RegA family two-component response regulator